VARKRFSDNIETLRRYRQLNEAGDLRQHLDLIEQLVADEQWREARDELQVLSESVGVRLYGTVDVSVHVYTEWLPALDQEDRSIFLSFVDGLRAIAEVVWPRAIRAKAPPFEMMRIESLLTNMRQDTPLIESMRRSNADAFMHGPFLVILTKGVTDATDALNALDEASSHIQGDFPEVLYGKVYVRRGLRPAGSHDSGHTRGGRLIAGAYQAATDTVTISMYATPERNSVMTLIHEFGHRYGSRFLRGDKREEFIQLHEHGEMVSFTPTERHRAADEYLELLRHHQHEEYPEPTTILSLTSQRYFELFPREWWRKIVPLIKAFRDDRDVRVERQLWGELAVIPSRRSVEFPAVPEHLGQEPGIFASEYGRTNWEENFAESFLAFCMKKPLPHPLERFMRSLR